MTDSGGRSHEVVEETDIGQLISLDPNHPRINPVIATILNLVNTATAEKTMRARLHRDELIAGVRNPNRAEQLAEQEVWLEELWRSSGATDVFQQLQSEEITWLQQVVTTITGHATRALSEINPSNQMEAMAKRAFIEKMNHAIRQHLIGNIALYSRDLGILDNRSAVHLHDMCCQDGVSSAIVAFLRRQENTGLATSCLCSDSDEMELGNHAFVSRVFKPEHSQFILANAPYATFRNHPGRDTYWLVKEPGEGINLLMQRAIEASQTDNFPKGIALGTCYCHCFSGESYPFDNARTPILDTEQWRKLTDMVVVADFDPNEKSRTLAIKAMRLIDCARAKHLMLEGKNLHACVKQMPGAWTSGIIIKRQ